MANTAGEALAISVPELVQQNRFSNWTRLAHVVSPAEPLRPMSGKELVTAIEENHEQDSGSEVRSSQRWSALDQLLLVSFGLISPAYLFSLFP